VCAFAQVAQRWQVLATHYAVQQGGEQHSLPQPLPHVISHSTATNICNLRGCRASWVYHPDASSTSLSWNGAWSAPTQPSSGRASTLILWHKQCQNSRRGAKLCRLEHHSLGTSHRGRSTQEAPPPSPYKEPLPHRPDLAERFNVASSASGQTTTRSCQLDAQIIHLARGPLTRFSATTANTSSHRKSDLLMMNRP
jgi:hypothetical protein